MPTTHPKQQVLPATRDTSFIKPPEGYSQIEWFKMYVDSKFAEINLAVDKVESTYKDYRATQNEWRGQLNDQAATFARKEVIEALTVANREAQTQIKQAFESEMSNMEKQFDTAFARQHERLTKLEMMKSNIEGRIWAIGAFISFIVIVVNWYFSSRK